MANSPQMYPTATTVPVDVPTSASTGPAGIGRCRERARAYVDPATGKENLTYTQLMALQAGEEDE